MTKGTLITLVICFVCMGVGSSIAATNETLGAVIMIAGAVAFFGYGFVAMTRHAKKTKVVCPYCHKELPPTTLKQMGRSVNAVGRTRAYCPYCGGKFDPSFSRQAR
ncbi:MAG: hypothetical protein IJ396_01515 [Oscillibacter sp.]|nr:hypothetical protein [Oscillibacter sp.]